MHRILKSVHQRYVPEEFTFVPLGFIPFPTLSLRMRLITPVADCRHLLVLAYAAKDEFHSRSRYQALRGEMVS